MPVLNRHHLRSGWPPGAVNVMRGTPFGNPFPVGEPPAFTRAEAVARYRRWLWARLRNEPAFADQVRALHGRPLVCCCAPLACHADVLERAAAWLQQHAPSRGVPESPAIPRPDSQP